MIPLAKIVIVTVSLASLVSGGAIVALSGGPGPAGGSDYGLDADGDSLFDWLVVRMDLRVEKPNWYNVWATLGTEKPMAHGCGFDGAPIPLGRDTASSSRPSMLPQSESPISWASVRQFLEAGDHEVTLAFRGSDIGYAAVDGPYTVRGQVHADGDWAQPTCKECMNPSIQTPVPAPSGWDWTYVTQRYDAKAFEEPRFAIRFTGEPRDSGFDLDGDGLYDYLVVEADANVELAGTYSIGGTLSVRQGESGLRWIAGSWASVDLAPGRQAIDFRFNGGDIWASGAGGPFDFALDVWYGGIGLYGDGNGSGTIREGEPYPAQPGGFDRYGDRLCGTTAEYRHDRFEERVEPAKFTGVFRDYGEDLNSDGRFEALVVEADFEVVEANRFDLSGQIFSQDGSVWIGGANEQPYLEVGVHTVALRFRGADIRQSGVDGPYRVVLNLVVANRDPAVTVYTAAYRYTDFEEEETKAKTHWIANLSADGSAILVTVVRGDDLLTYVLEDILRVEAYSADGRLVLQTEDKVSLPSGGDSQSFTFSWDLQPGTYHVRAVLGPSDMPNDIAEIVVAL